MKSALQRSHICNVDEKVLKKDREARLAEVVKGWEFSASGTLQVKYMYYDTHDGHPTIWQDQLYPHTMKRSACRASFRDTLHTHCIHCIHFI